MWKIKYNIWLLVKSVTGVLNLALHQRVFGTVWWRQRYFVITVITNTCNYKFRGTNIDATLLLGNLTIRIYDTSLERLKTFLQQWQRHRYPLIVIVGTCTCFE